MESSGRGLQGVLDVIASSGLCQVLFEEFSGIRLWIMGFGSALPGYQNSV